MIKPTLFALSLLSVLLVTATQSQTANDGPIVEALGVCDLSGETPDCWDMSGIRSPQLVEMVVSRRKEQYSIPLRLEEGKKNRFLAVVTKMPWNSVSFMSPNHGVVTPVGMALPRLYLIRELPDAEQKEASAIAIVSDMVNSPNVVLNFKEGKKGKIQEREFEIGPWKEAAPAPSQFGQGVNMLGMVQGAKRWRLFLGFTASRDIKTALPITFQALGKDGKPIGVVDKNGTPVATDVYKSWFEAHKGKPMLLSEIKYDPARVQKDFPANSGAISAITNIDPRKIAKLKITIVKQDRIELRGFPLDPK